ncbi:MFS transporter [Thermodesulfobacteriota bacterium]
MNDNSPRLFYGWIIVAVSFLTLFFSLGVRVSFGVFYVAILDDYGWTRADTAGAFSLAMFVHALFAPISGYLIDRFSPRQLFPAGAAFMATGLIACSYIDRIWHLYIFFGVLIAIGVNMTGFAPNMAVVPRWFIRKKGTANGIALSGIGLGSLVVAMVAGLVIDFAGWRIAFLTIAAGVSLILIPASGFFLRRSPEEIGLLPDNEKAESRRPLLPGQREITIPETGSVKGGQWTFINAVKTPAFWWINLTGACHGFMVNMMIVHQAAYVVDIGFSPLLAASSLGLVGGLQAVGNVYFGFLSDRIGRERSLAIGAAVAFAGMILFIMVNNSPSLWLLYIASVLYGTGQGSYSSIYSSSMADFYSGPSFGRIIATISIGYGLGGALSSYMGGYFFDRTGSYIIPFLFLLASIITGAVGIWMASFQKQRTEDSRLNSRFQIPC